MSSCRLIYKSRKGFTLVELLLVVIIGLMVSLMAVSFFSTGSRMAVSIASQNRVNQFGRARIETIKNAVRMGDTYSISDNGGRINITNRDGTVTSFFYQDDDGSTVTVNDSKLMYQANADAAPTRILSMIERSTGQPIFSSTGPNTPVMIHLRFGDAPQDFNYVHTGAGTQAMDILTTVSLRNRF